MPTVKTPPEEKSAGCKFTLDRVFEAYEAAKAGLPETQIPGVLGVDPATYRSWKKKRLVFARAVEAGRAARKKALVAASAPGTQAVWEDALGRLPARLRKVWREVARQNKREELEKKSRGRAVSRLLARHGDKVTQHLYVHALFRTNFNKSEAQRKLNLPPSRVALWEREDPDFVALLVAVQQAKKDLFESKLVEAVSRGDTAAVIFANRTLNRDRGYHEKTEVEHTHTHALRIEDLPLDLETKKKVLAAYQQASTPALPAHDPAAGVIDAEVLSVLEGDE
jgi:hypothetical protein